jgi:hypothetical protein
MITTIYYHQFTLLVSFVVMRQTVADDMATIDERTWRPWYSIGILHSHDGIIRP